MAFSASMAILVEMTVILGCGNQEIPLFQKSDYNSIIADVLTL